MDYFIKTDAGFLHLGKYEKFSWVSETLQATAFNSPSVCRAFMHQKRSTREFTVEEQEEPSGVEFVVSVQGKYVKYVESGRYILVDGLQEAFGFRSRRIAGDTVNKFRNDYYHGKCDDQIFLIVRDVCNGSAKLDLF